MKLHRASIGLTAATALFAGALGLAALAHGAPGQPMRVVGAKVDDFTLEDQHGVGSELYYYKKAPAVVILTSALGDKPSERALAAMEKLHAAYQARGVAFFALDSTAKDTYQAIDKAAANAALPVLDDDLQLVGRALGVTSTAEAFVIDPKTWTIAYHGPIDPSFAAGRAPGASLAAALDAVLAGKAPAIAEAAVKGTTVDFPDRRRTADFAKITYTHDVAPILAAKCVACHAKGGVAPFAMNSYETVKGFAPMMREAIRARRMPPYQADHHGADFKNDLSLSDQQTLTLVNWVEAGAPRGDGEDPLAKLNYTAPEWPLGQPDVILDLPSFDVPATGLVPYQEFVVKNPAKEGKYLEAVAYLPGAAPVVHHIVAGWNPEGVTSQGQNWRVDTGGWGPGSDPTRYPADTGPLVPAGGSFVFQMHYTPNGKPMTDHTRVGFYYKKDPPKYILRQLGIADFSIEIPAGDARHHERGYVEFPADVLLYAVRPHAHTRAYATKLTIRYPDGTEKLLHDQPRYDFNWQREYVFKDWLPVPKGSKLIADYVYDNSDSNPANPDPKSDVLFGEQTKDEMLFTYLHYKIVGEDREHPRDDIQAEITKSISFSVLDDNLDGKIEPDELRGARFAKLRANFAMFDKNGDGGLDKEEYFAATNARARNADLASTPVAANQPAGGRK